jgi:hypothetical protein
LFLLRTFRASFRGRQILSFVSTRTQQFSCDSSEHDLLRDVSR